MKKTLKIIGILIFAGFVILQFFGIDKTNPPIVQGETLEAAVLVPPDVSQIMTRACSDCHTNSTIYPWYSTVQPIGWFLKNHIDDGKRNLNFSIFNTYSAKKKAKRLDDICELVQSKEMPLPSYLWIHRDAVLSDSDVKALCDWAKQESGKIAVE